MSQRVRLVQAGGDAPLEYEPDAPSAPLEAGQVRVAVEACGVCHRDLLDREGRFPFMRLPITPGHEATGRGVELGPAVTGLAVGARVATMHRDACGECVACARGDTTLCVGAAWVFGLLADGACHSLRTFRLISQSRLLEPLPSSRRRNPFSPRCGMTLSSNSIPGR